jgi:hypothetical protein
LTFIVHKYANCICTCTLFIVGISETHKQACSAISIALDLEAWLQTLLPSLRPGIGEVFVVFVSPTNPKARAPPFIWQNFPSPRLPRLLVDIAKAMGFVRHLSIHEVGPDGTCSAERGVCDRCVADPTQLLNKPGVVPKSVQRSKCGVEGRHWVECVPMNHVLDVHITRELVDGTIRTRGRESVS